MNILFIQKHFPCRSQTFVRSEIAELTRRGCVVYVASAIDLKEDAGLLDPGLASRTFYLEHDYIYRYAATGTYTDAGIHEKAARARQAGDDIVSRTERERAWDIVSRGDGAPATRERGFLETLGLVHLLRTASIEHIHCDFAEENVKLAYVVHQVTGVPFTFKLRAYDIFAEPAPDLGTWARAAKRVLTISRYNQDYLVRRLGLPRDVISVIYDGIDVDGIVPAPPYPHRPFRIVSASRLVEKKGYPYLLDACRRLLDRGIDFTCEIYGDGPMGDALRRQAEEPGLGGRVRLVGSRPHREILAAMEAASVVVLPCVQARNGDRDGTPNVLLEAMAKAVPVVSTRISGIPEVVDHGRDGLLVEPEDAEGLADAIQTIYRNGERAEALGREGRRTVERRFRVERTVGAFLELIEGGPEEAARR